MNVDIENRAKKNLKKLPAFERIKIDSIIKTLEYDKFDLINIEKLTGTKNRYKIRSGNYSIVLKKLSNTRLEITAIAHRKDIYNKLFGLTFSL